MQDNQTESASPALKDSAVELTSDGTPEENNNNEDEKNKDS